MRKIEVVVNKSDRLLKVLEKECPDIIFSSLNKALRQKDIIVNGTRVKENIVVPVGARIIVYVPDEASKKNMIDIVYEDNNILIVNKSKGIETCDGTYNIQNELLKQNIIVYPVHRLDRNTLGLVIFAKTTDVQNELISAFKNGNVEKYYYAEIYGNAPKKHDILNGYLLKNKDESSVMIYNNKTSPQCLPIKTEYEVIKSGGNTSLLSVKIKDGKTHQIRAHLAFNKMYIIGDGKYGKNEINIKYKAKTQHLKAYKIKFNFSNGSSLYYLNNFNLQLNNEF